MKIFSVLFFIISFPGLSQSKYELVVNRSQLTWKATYIIGGGHTGTPGLKSGNLLTSPEGKISSGEFTIDMNSIKNTDEKGQGNNDLVTHLKSKDFFDTDKFPEGFFAILQVTPSTNPLSRTSFIVKGLLSIKGITNSITFPASIEIIGGVATVKGEVSIDRTRWDINFESPMFFSSIKDGLISDTIEIGIDLNLQIKK